MLIVYLILQNIIVSEALIFVGGNIILHKILNWYQLHSFPLEELKYYNSSLLMTLGCNITVAVGNAQPLEST